MALGAHFVVALLLSAAFASTCAAPIRVLESGVEYYDLEIGFGDTQVYALGSLEPNQEYEVRTSSPGLFAAEFFVNFVCDIESLAPEPPSARALLNVEKTMFKTDANGLVTRCAHEKGKPTKYGVKIFARLEGFTTDSSLYTKPVKFNLTLEKAFLGIPNRAIGVLIFGAVLVVAVVIIVLRMPSLVAPLSVPLAGPLQASISKKQKTT